MMKRNGINIKRSLLFLLLPALLPLAGCSPSSFNNSYDTGKPMLPENEYPDESASTPVVDNTPEDKGELVDHIFEAEAAQFVGVSTNANQSIGGKCIAQSFFFDLSFGDSAIIRNITDTGNKYIFNFKSDKAYKCKMEVAVASAYSTDWQERNLSAMYDITMNEKPVDSNVVVPAGNKDQVKGGNNYTCIQKVEIPITIKEGENMLVMSVLAGVCNLDYINIKTSANITDFTPDWWEDDTVVTIDLPTLEEAGTINLACESHGKSNDFTLPALSEENGYKVSEDKKSYSFTFNGEEYIINSDGTYKFPEGTVIAKEEEPDPDDEVQDPNADPLPEVIINNKDFFEPNNWTTFSDGGAQPVEMNSALKFKKGARFDFFYVNGKSKTVHIGDKESSVKDQEIYNKDYTWNLNLSSKGSFDMILFATSNLPMSFTQGGNAGVMVTVEEKKLTIRNAWYGSEITDAVAEADVDLKLDGETKYDLAITANRVDGSNLKFSLAINGEKVALKQVNQPKLATTTDGDMNLKFPTEPAGSYGQRLCFIPKDNSIVRVYGLTLPEGVKF